MPFQRSGSAASTQLLSASGNELGSTTFSPQTPVIATKSALVEPSSKSRNDISTAASARKQHHVSFKEEADLPVLSSKPRGRNQRGSTTGSRADDADIKDKASEPGSSRRSTSHASSRQSRRDASEGESSTAVSRASAPTTSSRQRRSRHRSDKQRSELSQHHQNESSREVNANAEAHAAPSARSGTSDSPSKKDVRFKDGSNSAKRSRQHSAQGILPDLRGQDSSRSEAGTRSLHSASSRRDRFSRSQDARSTPGDDRQLFDPRRDDPVKFASQQRSQGEARSASGPASSAPSPRLSSAPSFQPQILMRRDPSNTSSGSQLGRNPTIKPAISDIAFISAVDLTDPKVLQAHLFELKKVYRSITSIEARLREAHQAEIDRARLNMTDYTPPDLRDPSYFIAMVSQHRQLAELHSSFLEMTCRPELPRDVQEYAEDRNLPSRLWQTAFHLMLESLRTSLSSHHHLQSNQRRAEILDHLTEFIYFAYSFYSALLESERYKGFRRAWLESLGDLSRYRMAVAGLATSMAMDGQVEEGSTKQVDGHGSVPAAIARIDDDDGDGDDESEADSDAVKDLDLSQLRLRELSLRKSSANPVRVATNAIENDKASIGTAALGDWDLTEKETWRQTAKGWYAMGVAEAPSSGRLQHHLGVLSRGDDELRAVYHLTKSLIVAKPFAPARDSILALFNQERQASRLHHGCSIEELFLYLHGILFTRVQLDDFEPMFDRFMARLTELVEQHGPAGLPQSVWTMMAAINIASLFQYGGQDSLLASLLLQQSGKSDGRSNRTRKATANAPTAILISSSAPKTDDNLLSELPREAEWDDPSDDNWDAGDVQIISLEAKGAPDEQEVADELPSLLKKAATLCFSMHSLTFDLSSDDSSIRSNPYNTTISTFLVSLCQSRKAFRMLERFIPWNLWLRHVELSVSLSEHTWPKCLSSSFITAQLLLPEDLCLRGILGLSRQLYDRNLWPNSSNDGAMTASVGFDNEVEVLDAADAELYTRVESAWRNTTSRRKDDVDASTSLDTIRACRLAFVARKLAKAARGFDLDTKTSTLSLSKLLLTRLSRQEMQDEQRELEARIQELQLQSSSATLAIAQGGQPQEPEEDDDDGFDSDWDSHSDQEASAPASVQLIPSRTDSDNPSEEIRALHARSCYLRSLLHNRFSSAKSEKAAERAHGKKSAVTQPNVCDNMVPGYTVLVVDTNILVIPGEIIAHLIDSKRWMVIVPLAVITELDGLRRNDNDVGREAERAILFLESRIKSNAKCFKVQTSRGNYLTDLSCRSEDIDFTWQGSATAGDGSPRLDAVGAGEKSVAARNVDEVILRLLAWQRDNFVDRRTVLNGQTAGAGAANPVPSAHKSVLLTLDRNLRLKAKSRGLASLDDKGAASLHLLGVVP